MHVAFRGKPQWTASVVFLTRVNFRLRPLPGVRLEPILGCSDLTEREAKRDLAAAAQTVYLHRWCQWSVGERERTTRESWSKSATRICEWVWIWTEPLQTTVLSSLYCIPAYEKTHPEHLERGSCYKGLPGQQNMRGLVASTDLEMESAETDEIMVSKENWFCLVDSVHLSHFKAPLN